VDSEPSPSGARAYRRGNALDSGPGPADARTVARLLRYALEVAVDSHWDVTRPGEIAGKSSRGRQIRLLAATIDRQIAHDVNAT
jgi:hypothetical protein